MSEWKKYINDREKVFYCAYCSLKNDDEVLNYLQLVSEYFNSLIVLNNKKENWVFDHIFKINWKSSENKNMVIANLAAAKITLDRLLPLLPNDYNAVLKEFLIDFICDIGNWILKIGEKLDFSWLAFNTNNSVSHSYYFGVRSLLYGTDSKKFKTYDARFVNGTLLIRHTIEQRIKGILGIDFIQDQKNRPVGLSSIIESFVKLSKLKCKHGIDLKRILKINNWANHYLHRGLRPAPWQLEWAEYELGKLFFVGETTNKKSLSIYASFETTNISELRNEFEMLLKEKVGELNITWRNDAEIYNENKVTHSINKPNDKICMITKLASIVRSFFRKFLT